MGFVWGCVGVFGVLLVTLQAQNTRTTFSCDGRTSGYYADVASGCQVYHMCDGLGRQFSYTCPNATLFQQRMLICDHWYMVNCSKSEEDYSANLLIGQREKPFVEDSIAHPYHRTPRPDLLTHPSASEYNIIYRTGRAQIGNTTTIVGVDVNDNESNNSSSDDISYSPPRHWSMNLQGANRTNTKTQPTFFMTSYPSGRSNKAKPKAIPVNSDNRNVNSAFAAPVKSRTPSRTTVSRGQQTYFTNTTPGFSKFVQTSTSSPLDSELLPPRPFVSRTKVVQRKPTVNFQSAFTATTPVYPKSVESTSPNPVEIGLVPPSDPKAPPAPKVNFISNFYATTPVYPKSVEATSPDPGLVGLVAPSDPNAPPAPKVNFKSDFIATTPVYPKSVEATSPDPGLVGLVAPSDPKAPPAPKVNFKSDFIATTPVYPKSVEATSPDPGLVGLVAPGDGKAPSEAKVNFKSDFMATTPVYPKFLQSTPPDPGLLGILAPQAKDKTSEDAHVPKLNLDFEPPKVSNEYKHDNETVEVPINPPSMFYQAPKFLPDYTVDASGAGVSSKDRKGVDRRTTSSSTSKAMNSEQWKDLRKLFLIPDYDFPLDAAPRPSYDSSLNSFQAKPPQKR